MKNQPSPEQTESGGIDDLLDGLPEDLHTSAIADNTGAEDDLVHGPYEGESENVELPYSLGQVMQRRRWL